ncbi:PAS domain-containing sensor histidine kinase [Methanolobus sp. WCC5]|uniref:PAS domain-containing sensor histidine kinase n=1 Tax=Methanolobus sp. WCC5 TaxID=3125785 RepID=UPI003253983C
MGDLIKESIVAIIVAITTLYLWNTGRKNRDISNSGWQMILVGFVLLSVGHVVDAFYNISIIQSYVENSMHGDVIENFPGEIAGFILIALGVIKWIPTIASAGILQKEAQKRQLVQNELSRKTSKLTGLLNSIPDMVFFKDTEGKYLGCNPAFSEFTNITAEQIKGKSAYELFPKEKADFLYTKDMEVIGSGKPIRYEICDDRSSETRYYETIKAPLFDADGSYTGLVGITRDISNHKENEELIKSRAEAEAASNAKSEFLTTMSHELRTPLNSIIGFSDVMLSGMTGEITEQQEKYLKNIAVSGKHLLELINNILDISKIEAGKMELEPEQFMVSHVIDEVVDVVSPLAIKKRIKLEIECANKVQSICADKLKFKQIIYNLMSNAIKFTQKDGFVKVSIRASEDMILISVTDSGIGISEEEQKHLFQPFRQIDNGIERHYEGTGLGLALVKKYVELHGGRIWVQSKTGHGSTFAFEIPVKSLNL